MLSIQHEDFNVAEEYNALKCAAENPGGIVMFVGLVRDMPGGLVQMTLEHYPEMTQKSLAQIIAEANTRWLLQSVRVVHRVGELMPSDQIVFVGVASLHRSEAFMAAEFIMDYLKTSAPFWKKEKQKNSEAWVQAREADELARARWS